ncbi:galactosylgalactosylxylosylprotein 3-beta-glucuronosyltransferase 1-like [Hyperolius riggenbachi]|uniref:galactosylgalactosylxylosylprotein 3-beta-glucuronosyltransferase 1-like n=1 Tax=Hyperolius riggenbachi TaxID=752182 RepID=UPI0035A27DE9
MMLTRRRTIFCMSLVCLGLCFLYYQSQWTSNIAAINLWYDRSEPPPIPTIYVITPTYARLVQKAELTRISNTFRLVPALHWIVVEDASEKTQLVTNFLSSCGIPYTHLNIRSPKDIRRARGTLQRNLGLSWLREIFYPEEDPPGVVYFADDDNTYSLELFEEMRYTKKVSVWPVAFVGGQLYESVNVSNGKVVGWLVKYAVKRSFAIDMAGFAVNLKLILEKPRAVFRLDVPPGYQEPSLLQDLVTLDELEPRAANCTKILVWHTKTLNPKVPLVKNSTKKTMEV